MYDCIQSVKLSRVDKKEFSEEIQAEIDLQESDYGWSNCYFNTVKSDLLHEEGECIACDWKHYMNTVSEEDKRNWHFIEAWEWDNVWKERQKNGYYIKKASGN